MLANSTLPFALNTDALANWLENLSFLPQAQAAHHLNQVLKQLKDESCHPSELLPLLLNITPLTLHFSNSLSNAATVEANLSIKARKLGKLSMQLPRQLALIFCQLVESKKLETTEIPTAIYYALQLIGYCLRCYCLFYQMPSATLWKKSALLYKLAVIYNCLTSPQTLKISDFKSQASIESVIKRNLLFSILMPRLYKNDEISEFFQLANQHANLLDITTDNATINFGFYWNLEKDAPPSPVKKNHNCLPAGFLAIDSDRISQLLQLGTPITTLNPSTQNKLALALSSYRQAFSSIIPAPPSQSKMIVGFTVICHYLQELNKLVKINQLGSSLPGAREHKLDFSLVPLEHQRNVFDTVSQAFTHQTIEGKPVNLHKTPNKTYLVAESRSLDCATGDIVLLYKEQHPVSVAIIRQQALNDLSNTNQLLLEQIPGSCSIYSLGNTTIDSHAIVVGEGTTNPQVFLANGKYSLDSEIPMAIGRPLILTACLESNSFFTRFRFNFEK